MTAKSLLGVAKPVGSDAREYREWVEQQGLRRWLEHQRTEPFVTLYGSACDRGSVFVHSMLVPPEDIDFNDIDSFTSWQGNPFDHPSCGLVYGGGDGARVELSEPWSHGRQAMFRRARQLVYGRSFDGYPDKRTYFELSQELAHAHGLHWVEERNAWCRLDDAGDVADFARVEFIGPPGGRWSATCVSVNRELLDMHMAATESCLVQMFDSTAIPDEFYGFTGGSERVFTDIPNGLES